MRSLPILPEPRMATFMRFSCCMLDSMNCLSSYLRRDALSRACPGKKPMHNGRTVGASLRICMRRSLYSLLFGTPDRHVSKIFGYLPGGSDNGQAILVLELLEAIGRHRQAHGGHDLSGMVADRRGYTT